MIPTSKITKRFTAMVRLETWHLLQVGRSAAWCNPDTDKISRKTVNSEYDFSPRVLKQPQQEGISEEIESKYNVNHVKKNRKASNWPVATNKKETDI